MKRVLMIDDDPLITEPLSEMLGEYGFSVTTADNGRAGLDLALTTHPDIVVLDVLMPEMDGWEVCREIRKKSVVPILLLTALGDEFDRVTGLELGADDYLTKPFGSRELIARIKALLRRVKFDQQGVIHGHEVVGDIRIDLDKRLVWRNDKPLTLRHKEFELLTLLMCQAGTIVDRAEIFDKVWGTSWLGDTRTLDVHVRWLREKIEDNPSKPQYLRTVHGVGYRFATPEELKK